MEPKQGPDYSAKIPVRAVGDPGEFAGTSLEKEFHAPYAAWKAAPSPESSAGMLKALAPSLSSAVRNYAGKDAPPVVRSQAKVMALKALEKYDPAQGKLVTFLHKHLQGLRRYTAQTRSVIQRPELVRIQQLRMAEASRELADELGRDPSDVELADRTGLSLTRIGHIRNFRPLFSEGASAARGDPEGGPLTAAVAGGTTGSDLERWRRSVYDSYDPEHRGGQLKQLIMEHYFGLNGKQKLPLRSIAGRAGVTPGRVSQLTAEIQADLDEAEKLDILR